MAMALALSTMLPAPLALPSPALAVDCNLLSGPIANPDPTTAGDPAWTSLEDQDTRVNDPSVFANDVCIQSLITSWEKRNFIGGTFTFQGGDVLLTPLPDFNGSASFEYRFTSWATSNWTTATFTILSVNDRPTLDVEVVACSSITVAEDSGPFTSACTWLGYPGSAYETGQTVTRHISSPDPGLFSAGPALSGPSDTYVPITFTPKANAFGSTTLSLWVTDNGGTANGGADTSAVVMIPVTIMPVDDAPVAADDTYSTPQGTALVVAAGSGVLKNDKDIDTGTITASKLTNPAHGTVSVAANGSFTYTPAAGYAGPDSFTYRATAGAMHDDAKVSVTVLAPPATPPPTPDVTQQPSTQPPPSATAVPGASEPVATGSPSGSIGPDETAAAASQAPGPSAVAGASPTRSVGPISGAGSVAAPGTAGGVDLVVLLLLVILALGVLLGVAVFLLYRTRRSRRESNRRDR